MKNEWNQIRFAFRRIAENVSNAKTDTDWLDRNGADALKSYRDRLGFTQHQLAEHLGVTNVYICQIETGKRSLSVSMAAQIGEKL